MNVMHRNSSGGTLVMRRWWGIALVLSALLPALVSAQDAYFGKNKVQYKKYTWSFIQSDHFDVYFAQDGQQLAEFTAVAAESAYASISRLFRYQLVNRVPIVVYNSHNDFQQTNVIGEYLEEGIGGVTELFKNRVVIPFEGDYRKFRHVIHHELVHAVINDMFYGGSIQSIISNNITLQIPLWFNEGLSEYAALKWDTNSDMFLRDATINQNLPTINQLYGYFAYRGGQSVFWYMSEKYGDQKIGELLNRIKSVRSVDGGFRAALGLNIEEFSERWQKEMKVLYWPDIAKREDPADYARRLTDHKKDGGFYNTSPAISPQGDRIAFITNRDDFFDVYIMNSVDGKVIEKLVDGQQTENLEELHLLTPGISWSPDGRRVALATKAGEEDAILLLQVGTSKYEKFTFGLQGIFSVAWSPRGDKIAFVGNKANKSDIFVYDLTTQQLTNLTDDPYSDAQPVWSPDEETIYFSSDRGASLRPPTVSMNNVDFSQADLYGVGVATGAVERLLAWPNSDETSPVVSPDGRRILFVSDRNGINNVYQLNLETREYRPVTNSLSGVYQLSLSADGSKLAFTSLNKSGFDIFLMRNPFDRMLKVNELEMTEYFKEKFRVPLTAAPAVAARDTSSIETMEFQPADSVAIAAQGTKADTAAAKDSTGLYGEGFQIDFSNYAPAEERAENVPKDSTIQAMPAIANNVDEDGNFRVNRYKLNFTPDIIYGNAGYDTFYGVSGSTVMAFSDLLGDHQIILSTNLLLDLKNSDYGIQYFYLPNRIDFGFGAFHSARFVLVNDIFGGSLYRFRTYGGQISALLPNDRFTRFEFGVSYYNILRENMDVLNAPIQERTVIVPGFGYVYDTILWGFTSPVTGTRYRMDLFGTPRMGRDGLSFVNVTADYRTYFRLGRSYSFALRFAGGASMGENPQKFMIGGVQNWINPQFEGGYVPITQAEDYLFLQTGVPLRGYNYNAKIGSRYALFNMEFRYPLFAFLQAGPLPLGLQSFGGSLFFDAGTAWNYAGGKENLKLFTRTPDGSIRSQDLLMGMGTGARVLFLFFLLRLDVAWAWNVDGFSSPKYYFSLGADF